MADGGEIIVLIGTNLNNDPGMLFACRRMAVRRECKARKTLTLDES